MGPKVWMPGGFLWAYILRRYAGIMLSNILLQCNKLLPSEREPFEKCDYANYYHYIVQLFLFIFYYIIENKTYYSRQTFFMLLAHLLDGARHHHSVMRRAG